ncbi:hypothetical protein BDQ17DRAFT_1435177 [Cyathus striatus]|nr:hypothetical protein BDQ17DRAFT_1435177 [Cyathus striatus]
MFVQTRRRDFAHSIFISELQLENLNAGWTCQRLAFLCAGTFNPEFPSSPQLNIPRAEPTEQLKHAVPSALNSAASILSSLSTLQHEDLSVVALVSGFDFAPFGVGLGRGDMRSGFTSPIGSLRSPSPSPGRR